MTDLTMSAGRVPSCAEATDLAAAFVLGALDADEAEAVRAHLASCAEAHAEFDELAGVLEVLAHSAPVLEPPASLGPRIRAAAAADLAARGGTARLATAEATAGAAEGAPPPAPTAVADPTASLPAPVSIEAARARRLGSGAGTWALRIAAVLAIAGLGAWNVLLQGQLGEAQRYERDVAAVLDVAGEEGSLTAVLTPEGSDGPSGIAAVAADGSVRLAMRDLAPTAGTEVYEAWVIAGDGVPRPLGGFTVGPGGVASFEADGLPTEPGIVLALTREPVPGATTPTTPVVSLGTATAG